MIGDTELLIGVEQPEYFLDCNNRSVQLNFLHIVDTVKWHDLYNVYEKYFLYFSNID